MYKCEACGKQFRDRKLSLDSNILWQEYTTGKQTYAHLSVKYNCSIRTIQRRIEAAETTSVTNYPARVNLLMDTTYFGRKFGVMVFKDAKVFFLALLTRNTFT